MNLILAKAMPRLRFPTPMINIAITFACCILYSNARAVSPAPDGGYPIGNTAEGEDALFSLTSGYDNAAVGYQALYYTTSGTMNTGTGFRALYANTTGLGNTATGNAALSRTTTGSNNTATGLHAMFLNTTGKRNTAEGALALNNNTTGSSNIALGYNAGSSLTTGNYNIDIGSIGVAGESGTLRVGTPGNQNVAYVAGIYGTMEASGVNVTVGPDGHLGTMASSARFKEAIAPMDKASEAILSLQPVSFRYKHELDPKGTHQFGLIAEEVGKVSPELVARDGEGKVYAVRYEAVNAMLLNEFLKEHRNVQTLESTVAQQQKQIEALTAGLQKVTARLEAVKPSSYVVNDW